MEIIYADMVFYPKCMEVEWGVKDCGFGRFTFFYDDNDNLRIDSESMNKDTVKAIMNYLVDVAKE